MLRTALAIFLLGVLLLVGRRFVGALRPSGRVHVGRAPGEPLVLRGRRRIGIAYGLLALIPAAVLASLGTRAWVGGGTGAAGFAGALLAAALVVAFSAHQFASAFRSRLVVDDAGIERVGAVTRRRVRWGDVARVVYNPHNHWFFLTAADGTRLWVSEELDGIGDFAALALARLPRAAVAGDPNVREVLEELAASVREG
jgi:hypothetical protein